MTQTIKTQNKKSLSQNGYGMSKEGIWLITSTYMQDMRHEITLLLLQMTYKHPAMRTCIWIILWYMVSLFRNIVFII